MKRSRTVSALAASLLFVGPALAVDRPSTNRHTGLVEAPLAGLRRAADRGDRAELGRWAARIGVARLARAVVDSDRGLALAALDSAPYLPGRLLLLDTVLARCDSPDPQVSERALRTTGALLRNADSALLDVWEVPDEVAQRACRVLAMVASRADRPVNLRLEALQSLADANAICGQRNDLQAVLRDSSPDIRRAAVLLLQPASAPAFSALREASKDSDPSVASAAGAALCRQQLAPSVRRAAPLPALSRPLRELVLAPSTPVEDAAEMLACLAASTDPADAKALEELRRKGNPALRGRTAR